MNIEFRADALDIAAQAESVPDLEQRRLQAYLAIMCGDIAMLIAAFTAAGYAYLGPAGVSAGLLLAQLVLPVFLTVALYNGAYSLQTLLQPGHAIIRALIALLISSLVVIFIAFYTKSSRDFSRVAFTSGVLFAAVLIPWCRAQLRALVAWRCGARVINELVIDDGGPALDLPGARCISAARHGLEPELSDPIAIDRIGTILRNVDRVIVSCPPERRLAWAMIFKGAAIQGEVIDDSIIALGAQGARHAGGRGLLLVSVGTLGLRARAMKRLLDLVLTGIALIAFAPLMLIVAAAIMLEDGGPALFVQRRIGQGNTFFAMYKFRSMAVSRADRDGQLSTARSDVRVTRVGRLIRRTSIDELPQLLNVLIGNMSLVGPRPHAIGSHAGDKLFWEVDARYWLRHALKPGLTGLAQVRGLRGATHLESDLASRLNADLEYMNGWSLWRDLRIIAGTLRVLVHDKAF
jgi:lipopolysaccharide/colanic/teichoic acid biosynthesis glycosyltransferase